MAPRRDRHDFPHFLLNPITTPPRPSANITPTPAPAPYPASTPTTKTQEHLATTVPGPTTVTPPSHPTSLLAWSPAEPTTSPTPRNYPRTQASKMGKSLRSSIKKANRATLRNTLYSPHEAERTERLSRRLRMLAEAAAAADMDVDADGHDKRGGAAAEVSATTSSSRGRSGRKGAGVEIETMSTPPGDAEVLMAGVGTDIPYTREEVEGWSSPHSLLDFWANMAQPVELHSSSPPTTSAAVGVRVEVAADPGTSGSIWDTDQDMNSDEDDDDYGHEAEDYDDEDDERYRDGDTDGIENDMSPDAILALGVMKNICFDRNGDLVGCFGWDIMDCLGIEVGLEGESSDGERDSDPSPFSKKHYYYPQE